MSSNPLFRMHISSRTIVPVLALLFGSIFLPFPEQALALSPSATLHFAVPASAKVQQEFTVDVLLDTGGQAVGGIQVALTYSSQLEYLGSDAVGSVLDHELLAPTSNGTRIEFARMRFDQGFNGTNGLLLRTTFRSRSEGTVPFAFDSAFSEVTAYADSSNILSSAVEASLSFERAQTMGGGGSSGVGAGGVSLPPPPPFPEPTPYVKRVRLRQLPLPTPSSPAFCETIPQEVSLQEKGGKLLMTVDRKQVVFRDVPLQEWFAGSVAKLITSGIASGYKDTQGMLTGIFGSGDPVTYAEIAKMALKAARKESTETQAPQNPTAKIHWGAAFIAEAEQVKLTAFLSLPNVDAPAPRGAVLQTVLEALGIPLDEEEITYRDVPSHHPNKNAIATATALMIVEGDTNAEGVPLGTFRPDARIKRVETAKIIVQALKVACGE